MRTSKAPTSPQLGCAQSFLPVLAHQLRGSHLLPQLSAFSLSCLNFFFWETPSFVLVPLVLGILA